MLEKMAKIKKMLITRNRSLLENETLSFLIMFFIMVSATILSEAKNSLSEEIAFFNWNFQGVMEKRMEICVVHEKNVVCWIFQRLRKWRIETGNKTLYS